MLIWLSGRPLRTGCRCARGLGGLRLSSIRVVLSLLVADEPASGLLKAPRRQAGISQRSTAGAPWVIRWFGLWGGRWTTRGSYGPCLPPEARKLARQAEPSVRSTAQGSAPGFETVHSLVRDMVRRDRQPRPGLTLGAQCRSLVLVMRRGRSWGTHDNT